MGGDARCQLPLARSLCSLEITEYAGVCRSGKVGLIHYAVQEESAVAILGYDPIGSWFPRKTSPYKNSPGFDTEVLGVTSGKCKRLRGALTLLRTPTQNSSIPLFATIIW